VARDGTLLVSVHRIDRNLAGLMSLPEAGIGGTGITTTILGFGCGTLFRAPDPADRERLLAVAYEAGIRHFDVAPMYGLGRAELELGRFIRSRRSEVTVATKFGIRPTRMGRCLSAVQRPARRLLRLRTGLSNQVRTHAAAPSRFIYAQGGFDAAGAGRSLRASLQRLRTDYLDLLLLHDPAPESVRSAELEEFLDGARTAGLVRSWGLTGAPEIASEVAAGFRDVPVQQVHGGILAPPLTSNPHGSALITYGVLGGPLRVITEYMLASDAARKTWSAAVGADCSDPRVIASLLLRAALRDNRSGVVLFGATRAPHIATAAAVARQHGRTAVIGGTDLDRFTLLVRQDLAADRGPGGRVDSFG
jgi:D-threo-aldose 1-dehydrogenase